jgi:hypothetical protein
MTFDVTMRFYVRYRDRSYRPGDEAVDDVFEWSECVSESEAREIFILAHPLAYIVHEERVFRRGAAFTREISFP